MWHDVTQYSSPTHVLAESGSLSSQASCRWTTFVENDEAVFFCWRMVNNSAQQNLAATQSLAPAFCVDEDLLDGVMYRQISRTEVPITCSVAPVESIKL